METGSTFAELQSVLPSPVFALMATLPAPLPQIPFDAATLAGDKDLQWICRDTSKPGHFT
jgi:predicted NAD/FAD-dependent oxidoreductase